MPVKHNQLNTLSPEKLHGVLAITHFAYLPIQISYCIFENVCLKRIVFH
ncbi:hypothetical protein BLA6992_00151 [Burkholderia lata]|nr:hypothetical protein BLA6860_07572 [Burkholderia lata]VWL87182.1 hypothetical protein BLA6992_00151 [Burkholderia lata]